jgi:4-hydroxy-tetrahydrodipicolinate reductase
MMVSVLITGVCGRMGASILKLALGDPGLHVAGVVEAKGHASAGRPVDGAVGTAALPLIIGDDLAQVIHKGDVVIDFTEPEASLAHFRMATANGRAIVLGTTGFDDEAVAEIKGAQGARVVLSPNMSVGMNLMFDIVERLAKVMKDDYDIEIVEMHHKMKKDAPSGTALKLKEIVESTDRERQWVEVFGRKGILGARHKDEIGVLSLRGGDVVGEHTVMFAGIGERLEISHRAFSRENFARGALVAAKWISGQSPGLYSMKDVLGL